MGQSASRSARNCIETMAWHFWVQDVQPRLQACEKKLYGVENLTGRSMAVDDMADILGVIVPQVGAPSPKGI